MLNETYCSWSPPKHVDSRATEPKSKAHVLHDILLTYIDLRCSAFGKLLLPTSGPHYPSFKCFTFFWFDRICCLFKISFIVRVLTWDCNLVHRLHGLIHHVSILQYKLTTSKVAKPVDTATLTVLSVTKKIFNNHKQNLWNELHLKPLTKLCHQNTI